jgi:hypothetical protein
MEEYLKDYSIYIDNHVTKPVVRYLYAKELIDKLSSTTSTTENLDGEIQKYTNRLAKIKKGIYPTTKEEEGDDDIGYIECSQIEELEKLEKLIGT